MTACHPPFFPLPPKSHPNRLKFPARFPVDEIAVNQYLYSMKTIPYQQMVRAMQQNDQSFNGRFYVGVHSTGIFCLPSCRAKLPLLKNVRFYPTREEAISAGLRGCKRCRAEKFPNSLPSWLYDLLRHMRAHCEERMSESRLVEIAGVDVSTVRRHFKETLGITPLAFHRKLRLEHARELIENGERYLDAAYAVGYESPSAFRDAFVRQFGKTPGECYVQH